MLKNLRIRNYRAITELRIDELRRINLISGKNNSGKTTVLESLFLLSEGHAQITLHPFIIRGMKSDRLPPNALSSIYWRQMFSSLDFGTPIEVAAEHESMGSLTVMLERVHDKVVKRPVNASEDSLMIDRRQHPTLVANYTRNNSDWKSPIRVTDKEIQMEQRGPDMFPAAFVASAISDLKADAQCLEVLKRQKRVHRVVAALSVVDDSLKSLEVMSATGTPMIWADVGLPELVPLPTVGEGMVHITRLAMCMELARGGVLLVDEIENGIHHSIATNVWSFILATAQELDVQVFVTTHSYECLQAAQSLNSDQLAFHRLEYTEAGHRCVTFQPKHLETAVRHNLEVR